MLALILRGAIVLGLVLWTLGRLRAAGHAAGRGDPLVRLAQWWHGRARGDASAQDPHAVLGVAPGASMGDIRAAYQRQMQRYHPDQVAHLGEELREVAERRSKAINAAYAQLKRRA